MSGFVVIRREALDHHLIGSPDRFYAWCWLIATACWKPTKFDINGKTVTLERGQLCVSRNQLSEAWGWSASAVERFLTRLQTEQMIGRETGQGRSVITIHNYAKYQDIPSKSGQATGQAIGQRSDSDRTAKEPVNQVTLSNDNAPIDPWAPAIAYLGEKKRGLIGKWIRDNGAGETIKAVTEAQLARAVDPVAYIERVLRQTKQRATAGEIW